MLLTSALRRSTRRLRLPLTTWTGSYIGVAGGGAWGNAVVRNDATASTRPRGIDLSGGIIGVTSGFNIQSGNVVLGYEGDTSIDEQEG